MIIFFVLCLGIPLRDMFLHNGATLITTYLHFHPPLRMTGNPRLVMLANLYTSVMFDIDYQYSKNYLRVGLSI